MGPEIALLAAGTAFSAVGAAQEASARADYAQAQADAADYNRAVTDRRIEIARQRRKNAIRAAQIDVEDRRRENRRALSTIRNNMGASGLTLAGTPLDIIEDAATELALDEAREEHKGRVLGYESAIEILGLENERTLYDLEGDAARSRRGKERLAGVIGVGGALARGGAKVAGTDYAKENWW